MFDTLRNMARTPKVLDPKRRALIMMLHVAGRAALWPFARRREPSRDAPTRILLMRVDGVGDFVMTSGLFPALRRAYPDARIDLLCSTLAEPLAQGFVKSGDLNHLYAVPLTGRHFGQIRNLARELRANRYDVAADLRGDFRNVLTAFVAKIPRRCGFSYSGFDYLLTDIVPGAIEQVGVVHQVNEVSQIAELLGAGPLPGAPRIDPPEEDRAFARRWLAEHGRAPDRPLIAFHLSAGMPARLWPLDRFIDVARRLKDSRNAQFLVVGASTERALGEQLGAGLGERPLIAAGDATLGQSVALLELCALFIGTDSGPAHLASAARCPVVVLFGPGNVQVMRPYTDRCVIVRSPRPCDKRCHNKTCAVPETHCMKAIRPADVVAAAQALLGPVPSTTL